MALRVVSRDQIGLLFRQFAQNREFEYFALKRLHHQHQPDNDCAQSSDDRNQRDEKRANQRNQEKNLAGKYERAAEQQARQGEKKTLKALEAHKTVLAVRLDQKENCSGNE